MPSKPIVIAVMGPAGSGKTNFINRLMGTEASTAHFLEPHTRGVREFAFQMSNHRRYVFADFPSFDDTYRTDRDKLCIIAEWLEEKYRANVKLNGIIYTHRITEYRMSGSVWKNLAMFSKLCGDRAAGGVRLVTTMWDKVAGKEIAEDRASQLEANRWKPLIDAGARHKRFEENSSTCAWGIVEDLTGAGEPLLLQEELVDEGRYLNETTAGQALYAQLQKLLKERMETIEQLRVEAKALRYYPRRMVEQLEVEQRQLKAELQQMSGGLEKLRIPFSRYIALFFSKKTHANSALTFKDVDESPFVAKNDYVIFVVGPTEEEKTWFTLQLCRGHIGVRHPHTKYVKAWRCKLSNGSDNIIIVNTPSRSHCLDAETRMADWLESKFTQTCHSGILLLQSLDPYLTGDDKLMSWRLEEFATAFRNKFTVPPDVYVVPTCEWGPAFRSEALSHRLARFKTTTERLNGKGSGRDWHACMFPGVFRGQPEMAWGAALLLLKGIADTQTKEFFASPRPALTRMPQRSADARLVLKDLADPLFKEFKKKVRHLDLEAIITLGQITLDFMSLQHSERHSALIDVLSQQFNKEEGQEDFEKLIMLIFVALADMFPDECQRQTVHPQIDDHLSERLKQGNSTVDPEEIISLRRAALERIPPPYRCSALLDLADALHEQFQKGGTKKSLAEAISLARAASLLCPPGHPDHALSRCHLESYLTTTRLALNILANSPFKESGKQERDHDLDAMITLGRTALELTPPRHLQRLSVFVDLGGLLSERYKKEGRKEDLDELIAMKRTEAEYMSPDKPQRHSLLLELDDHLSERFKQTDSTVDLEEIISLRRAVLECIPPPNRCRALLNLANAFHEQFRRQGTENSIGEAVSLARTALGLCPPGNSDRALSQEHLAGYLETKVEKKESSVHMRRLAASPSSPHIEALIKKALSDKLEKLPLRLLHTSTGVLCDRDAQISHFESSPQYQHLLSLASSLDSHQVETEISNAISEYFEYATLSHRWGSGEPLLRDIEGRSIYDLRGTGGQVKLQKFCIITLRHHFQWAWSDTCCIDKDSSAELQEAIVSMFSWYHWSSLTVVYLSDVFDGGSLAGSVWFTRGWTLQELLASRAILFYTYDWSLYSKNNAVAHKSDPALLEELQSATGIAKQHLTNFYPGMDDARSRLHWASRRRTTRPEDVAYSLFGIFQVHLPIFYGESAQNALGRLLAEIISRSGDVSVLDWVGKPSSFNSCFPVDLAPYQTVPHFPLILSDPGRHTSLDLDKAQQLYSSLKRLPRAGFVNSKLTLPSTVHPLTAVKLQGSSTSPSRYTYEIQASRLQPLNVTLSVELDESVDTYILVRPWHPKTLEQQADRGVDAVWKLLEQLEQPFNALLLKRSLRNEYERIACDCTITTRIQDITSILDSEVLIPEIV